MEKKELTVQVSSDVCELIEALQYEVESRKEIISFMLSSGMDIHSDSFKKYEKQYIDFFIQYNEAKNRLEADFVRPFANEFETWNLDFTTQIITIKLKK